MVASILPLRLVNAGVRRRSADLVGPVDFEIGGSGLTIVMGPNGSGKTSLLRLMHGLERADTGEVAWARPMAEARRQQAFVFQTPIMMRRTVVDSIAYSLIVGGVARGRAREKARVWAGRVGLADALDRSAQLLSGGEQQKLALARALVRDPEVLLLDEPCASLDGRATREIEAILIDARAAGTRIVMATHDMGQARRLADDVLFMLKGRLHECAAANTFFDAPRTEAALAFLSGQIVD